MTMKAQKAIMTSVGLILVFFLIAIQIRILSAFEAQIVNVTAHICSFSETKTMGFWKNHPEIYAGLLPQCLGSELIDTSQKAEDVFKNAKAKDMKNMLTAQLLAMKFNITYFKIGDYFVESEGKTLNQIVFDADALLTASPEPLRETLERMKNLLDYLNNLHKVKMCSNQSYQKNGSSDDNLNDDNNLNMEAIPPDVKINENNVTITETATIETTTTETATTESEITNEIATSIEEIEEFVGDFASPPENLPMEEDGGE